MLLFPRGDWISVRMEYDKTTSRIIASVPGAEFREWEWCLPRHSLRVAMERLQLNEGHLYPYLTDEIDPLALTGLEVKLSDGRMYVEGEDEAVRALEITLDGLMSCTEVREEYKKGRGLVKEVLENPLWEKRGEGQYVFPLGLTRRVRNFLGYFPGVKCEYSPARKRPPRQLSFGALPPDLQARDYQISIAGQCPAARRATLLMPTGAGKTVTSGLMIRELAVPTLFLTYSRLLLHQTVKSLTRTLGVEVGAVGEGEFRLAPVTVATIQSLNAILGLGQDNCREIAAEIRQCKGKTWEDGADKRECLMRFLSAVDCVFVDEGHQLGAETIYAAATCIAPYYAFALTANAQREDGKEILIEAATGPAWKPPEADEKSLIEQGFLLPVKVAVVPFYHAQKNTGTRRDMHKLQRVAIVENSARNKVILSIARYYQKKYKTLLLVKQIDHGEMLAGELGVPFIHGGTTTKARRDAIQKLVSGEIGLLVASSIMEQGVDIPEVELLIDAVPRKKVRAILQPVGRVRRPWPGKTQAMVVMIYDIDHGGIFEKQSRRKLDIVEKAGWDVKWVAAEAFAACQARG